MKTQEERAVSADEARVYSHGIRVEREDRLLYVGGQKTSYRCECGCNVFRYRFGRTDAVVCNSCGAAFIVEKR